MVMAPSILESPEIFFPEKYCESTRIIKPNNHGANDLVRAHEASKDVVVGILKERAADIDIDSCAPGEEDPFYVADLGEVYRQHQRWKMNLPRVKPFYAVKCNPDAQVLRLMALLGNGFDCASRAEIDLALAAGVHPDRIIYAHPCKTASYLRYAAKVGVKQMTFDNADELYKIKHAFPGAKLFLRILTDDSNSLCRLSVKFGASLDIARNLLELARELDLNVVGVSFHVGSGAEDPKAFVKAVQDARWVFDQASDVGFDMKVLDVGGGFSSDTFDVFADTLGTALDEYFPSHIRVIAEPGRYYVASAFTLAAHVIARRDVCPPGTETGLLTPDSEDVDVDMPNPIPIAGGAHMIYLNDGVYGNFSNIIFDHQHPVAQILLKDESDNDTNSTPTAYSIWGPTCDGIDVISQRVTLDGHLRAGDWLYFENMGAYTQCSATKFNGFPDEHKIIYISTEHSAASLLGLGY